MIDFSSGLAAASSLPAATLTPPGQASVPTLAGTPVVIVDLNINITVDAASSGSPGLAHLPAHEDTASVSTDFSPPAIARTSARPPARWRDLSLYDSLHGPSGYPMRHALRDPDLLRVLWNIKTLPRPDRDLSQERTAP
ncbi:hypothetical protein [Xylophilus sp. GOD-11R]|uniref:hypothetical protein n=1 Tax=Xylophilus sp. GOD-11R TaxID=3089814 RepID=UPI00298CEEAC|nr:hypothetical protein [Xylophilus sp. GOD-11R]WPB57522.1 hypothetical protein R9X41_02370 [Xylophilus sp. GOD-11R]